MRRFEYLVPASVSAAARLCSEAGSKAKAGGVDLVDLMKEGLQQPSRVIGLQQTLSRTVQINRDDSVRIGAGCTLAQLERDAVIRKELPSVAEAAGHTATPQVRNMATVGGNLLQTSRCWYLRNRHYKCIADGGDTCFALEGRHEHHALFDNQPCAEVHASNLAPALISLNAKVIVQNESSARRVPVQEILRRSIEHTTNSSGGLRNGEILTDILIPAESRGPKAAHQEVRHKQSFDWPLAVAAVNLNGAQPVLVLGAVAGMPLRIEAANAIGDWLTDPNRAALNKIAEMAVQNATPLPGNAWRIPILKTVVRDSLMRAATRRKEG